MELWVFCRDEGMMQDSLVKQHPVELGHLKITTNQITNVQELAKKASTERREFNAVNIFYVSQL